MAMVYTCSGRTAKSWNVVLGRITAVLRTARLARESNTTPVMQIVAFQVQANSRRGRCFSFEESPHDRRTGAKTTITQSTGLCFVTLPQRVYPNGRLPCATGATVCDHETQHRDTNPVGYTLLLVLQTLLYVLAGQYDPDMVVINSHMIDSVTFRFI